MSGIRRTHDNKYSSRVLTRDVNLAVAAIERLDGSGLSLPSACGRSSVVRNRVRSGKPLVGP